MNLLKEDKFRSINFRAAFEILTKSQKERFRIYFLKNINLMKIFFSLINFKFLFMIKEEEAFRKI